MLECVINISEGSRQEVLDRLAEVAAGDLLDVHSDAFHNRSVFTLGGPSVEHGARRLTEEAVRLLDIRDHHGVHPRIGVVDVVPFVPLPGTAARMEDAVRARDEYVQWITRTLGIPAFTYGPGRTLPQIRKGAFTTITPDAGPSESHVTAGAVAVGARPVLVAYNLWLATDDLELTRRIAAAVRTAERRTLGLRVGAKTQVSCNLINPLQSGPDSAYDQVAALYDIDHAELVGLLPECVLAAQPQARWPQLDLGAGKTIEARLARRASTNFKT